MNKINQERAEKLVFLLSFIGAIVGLVVSFVLIALEIYIRWTINQTFTLLGGNVLAALVVSVFLLILGMAYVYRPTK